MMEGHEGEHRAPYFLIFVVLCVFTGLSVIFDIVDMRGKSIMGMNGSVLLIALVLAVATAKALCVMAFFMHLKWEGNWKFLLLAPTIILAMGVPLALLPDIGVHYYRVDVPQVHAPLDDMERAASEQGASEQGAPEQGAVQSPPEHAPPAPGQER